MSPLLVNASWIAVWPACLLLACAVARLCARPPHAGSEYTYAAPTALAARTQAEVAWGQNRGGVIIYAR